MGISHGDAEITDTPAKREPGSIWLYPHQLYGLPDATKV